MGKTNPIPPGTQNVSINMADSLVAKLDQLADRSGVSRAAFCRQILTEAAEAGALVEMKGRTVYPESHGQAAEAAERPFAKPQKKLAG